MSTCFNSLIPIICAMFALGWASDQQSLIVGTASGYAPYVSINSQGEYEGFDIDVATHLAKKMNCKLVIKDFGSMPSLLLSLKQNKTDLLIWAISITPERLKNMDMIYYQGEKVTQFPLVFWKEIPNNIKDLSDLGKISKKCVCVEAGTYQESVLKQYPVQLKFIDKITDAVMEIKYGKSLATAIDHALLIRLQERHPELNVLHVNLPVEQQSLGNGICVSKKRPDLSKKIQTALEQLRSEGTILELEKKWKLAI